ncbi:uncharacterized protein LOC112351606 [Selaginella moellendorffii]|uniref:uncharacterized protein LOC112351606 n=1 Tax=Selaginella moellendorffii TaxID=88036 RepID=UPI000D1C2638|nr:uncharacterized protein LOC112351606 [Selaginella moellendorffii]|eukprot:XP_024545535.1 uncharacterized protein LOC112351606 [Selaginella moellendorffii]
MGSRGRPGQLRVQACFKCKRKGHMAWECEEGVICSKCKEKGHHQRNCKNVTCHKCKRKGHTSNFCNDPDVRAREAEKMELQLQLQLKLREKRKSSQQRKSDVVSLWDGLGDGKKKRKSSGDGVATAIAPPKTRRTTSVAAPKIIAPEQESKSRDFGQELKADLQPSLVCYDFDDESDSPE